MGLFSRRSRSAGALQKRGRRAEIVVTVAFRELGSVDPLKNFTPNHGYAYIWPFRTPPQIGQWAIAQGLDGEKSVIVGALGMPASARGMELKALRRVIPPAEVTAAQHQRTAPAHTWLDLARHAAGLPTHRQLVDRVPDGFDSLPPCEGSASIKASDRNGDIWWRAYNLSAELGRDADECGTFKAIAKHWYRERDRKSKEADERRMVRAVASVDLDAAIRSVRSRPRAEVGAMTFAGQPLWDWLKHAQILDKDGRSAEALALVEALIIAAEQEATLSGREPAPAYTERAAIIYRKRRDYDSEIAVLERWMNACPPEKRGPGALQGKLAERLVRARELAAAKAKG